MLGMAVPLTLTLAVGLWSPWAPPGGWPVAALMADDPEDAAEAEGGVFLPTDRLKERQLELARRLIKDKRWSDAATLLDEILSADRDFFFKPDMKAGTWRSVKAEAGRLVQGLPKEGSEAYALQFRARADRMLRDAIAAGDGQAIVAVARRWFHTPAGQKATLLAALEALDAGQPLAAAAWLDRLAETPSTTWQPTLAIMRAIAWQRAGDEAAAVTIVEKARGREAATARIGGRDIAVSFPPGGAAAWLAALAGHSSSAPRAADEWTMHRGEPARNAIVTASRPLLVPRFRVPLARHPDEARWLEERRKQAADQDAPLIPAAIPVAVGGTLVVHTPMGLLAIDFATGKRLWLRTGGAAGPVIASPAAAEDRGAAGQRERDLAPVFDDATSGTLSSDGRLVFAVESQPEALAARDPTINRFQPFGGELPANGWNGGNSLVAYDLAAKGDVAWRLPAAPPAASDKPAGTPWYLGAPLPISDQLFVLVEEAGEVRLDVLEARSGRTLWSQPLAELDEEAKVDNPENRSRRVAGLSPSLAEGVLVCPTGAGAVVAVDLATRTLLWAYNYSTTPVDDVMVMPNGMRVLRPGGIGRVVINGPAAEPATGRGGSGRWIDNVPVVAGGRALLTPSESAEVHCLDLRSGTVSWKRPRKESRTIAGVVGGKVIIVGRTDVQAVSLDDGRTVWSRSLGDAGRTISGRAMLSGTRLFVPVDSPEVVEIDLGDGAIVGRSPGRGGSTPGNLVAYRGEVISQGVESLDVFHQMTPLEAKIETASAAQAGDEIAAWATMWRGHLQLDRGETAAGIASLRAAMATSPTRMPPDMLAEAMLFAMERDRSVAATMWQEFSGLQARPSVMSRGLRAAVDGFVAVGDATRAWESLQRLLDLPEASEDASAERPLVNDATDRAVSMAADRWIRGRLEAVMAIAPDDLRRTISAAATARHKEAEALPGEDGERALAAFVERFASHPAAVAAGWSLVDRLSSRMAASRAGNDAARTARLRLDFALLAITRGGEPTDRDRALALLDTERRSLGSRPEADGGAAWPLGRVTVARKGSGSAGEDMGFRGPRVMPLPVTTDAHALLPGLRLGFDLQQPGLLVSDAFGRRLGGPLAIDEGDHVRAMGMGHAMATDAAIVGRVAVVRAGGMTIAYELAGAGDATTGKHRRLWTHVGEPTAFRMPAVGRVINRRFPRQGNVELGLRIREPDQAGDGSVGVLGTSGLAVHATGVPLLVNRTLRFCDPVTGATVWERHRLEPDSMIFGDDEFLCVWPRGTGRQTLVLSTSDGRLVRECEVPGPDRLLLTHGRFVITINPGSGGNATHADAVRLEALDPARGDRIDMGTYSGRARAAAAGTDAVAILEPGGRLTVIDLVNRRITFSTMLPDMPVAFEQVTVNAWQDRYLVMVSRPETEADGRRLSGIGSVSPLPQLAVPGQPMTGSIWAVDRSSGEMLWQVPATIVRHCLHVHQPPGLPILFFTRQVMPARVGDRSRLSVLCLDKRTGHAVFVDDKMPVRQDMLFGCEVAGDPAKHSITISPVGGGLPDIVLAFTGEPIAPQPPFQAGGPQTVSGDFAAELEYWFNRVLTWPPPF